MDQTLSMGDFHSCCSFTAYLYPTIEALTIRKLNRKKKSCDLGKLLNLSVPQFLYQ